MDYLDQLIQLAQVEGELNALCRFHGDWHIEHPTELKRGVFHIISNGECCVTLGEQQFHLTAGDVFFLPHGEEHVVMKENTSCQNTTTVYQERQGIFELKTNLPLKPKTTLVTENETVNNPFEMFCGYFRYTQHSALLTILPNYWVLKQHKAIKAILTLLQGETKQELGSASIVNSLSSVLFTYLVRDFIEKRGGVTTGILATLQDKRLCHAANAMLQEPGKDWNMENLAEICSMSRATFIRLFKQKSGTSPGKFLTELRMQKAEYLLSRHNHSMLNIALEIGYQSESHFSKAFKAYYGVSPGKYRSELRKSSLI